MKIKRKLLATLVAMAFSASAFAGNVIIQNEYVKAGVNETTGTLGSGGNTSPGLLYDSTGTGTFNTAYDYLTPGSPFEGFSVKVLDSSNTSLYQLVNNNAGNMAQLSGGAWVGTPTGSEAVWQAANSNLTLRHTYSLPAGSPYINITTRIDATTAMPHLYFARFIDPDARAAAGDSSATDNVLGYGAVPVSNVVFSEAIASRYALGLYTSASNSRTAITQWTTDPTTYYTNTAGGYGTYTGTYGQGDDTIGMAFYVSGLNAGDYATFRYAYIFGPSAFGAASSAVTGGAGGGTPGTAPGGGTLTDVGSATSAASSPSTPSAPTVTGTSAATITVSDITAVSSTLPSIIGTVVAHTPSEGNGKQTVGRETTTTTTTPMERTVTTLTRTTTTYSDSTTTTSDSATTATTTISNSVSSQVGNESFSGRIDQMSELNNLNKQLDRSLNMDAFRQDGQSDDKVTMFVNATGGNSDMSNGYNAKNQVYGLAVETNVDNNWRVGAQYNRVQTKMSGVDSNTTQDKNHVGLYSVYDLEGFKVVNNLGYADNSMKANRTLENVFNNNYNTTGNDLWLNNRVYTPDMSGFRPFVGVTFGRSTVGGYSEQGSIQSARTVAGTSDSYTYGEGGVRYEAKVDDFRLAGEIGQSTDGVTTGTASVGYAPNKDSLISVSASQQNSNGVGSTLVSLRGVLRF